jgi:hypothetical protein
MRVMKNIIAVLSIIIGHGRVGTECIGFIRSEVG